MSLTHIPTTCTQMPTISNRCVPLSSTPPPCNATSAVYTFHTCLIALMPLHILPLEPARKLEALRAILMNTHHTSCHTSSTNPTAVLTYHNLLPSDEHSESLGNIPVQIPDSVVNSTMISRRSAETLTEHIRPVGADGIMRL